MESQKKMQKRENILSTFKLVHSGQLMLAANMLIIIARVAWTRSGYCHQIE